jgi:hypothetical protein
MRFSDFETMVSRLAADIPEEFLDGIAEIVVSPRTVPHPDRDGVWTLGECVPIPGDDGNPRHIQSRVVIYHGSFQALARDTEGFDWKAEAWETLTHEVRHHVEWKARAPDLEAFDRAAEENYARHDGEPFDPAFYRDGVLLPDGSWQVDDDVFLERVVPAAPHSLHVHWRGKNYEVAVPREVTLPAYLALRGTVDPPPGDLVLVLQKRSGWLELFRKPAVFQADVDARRTGE